MEGMKHFLIHTNFNGTPEFHSYWADDEDHAIEQLDDSTDEYNVSQYITHIFVSDTEILNNESAKKLHAARQKSDEERLAEYYRKKTEFVTNLKVGDEIKWYDSDYNGGVHTIVSILNDSGKITGLDTVVEITDGSIIIQAHAHELE